MSTIVACNPIHLAPRVASEQRSADCGHEVWVSRTTLDYVEQNPDVQINCISCAVLAARATGEPQEVEAIPGALESIEERLGIDARQAFEDALPRIREMFGETA